MRVGLFKYFLFHDPNWDYRTLDWDRDLAYAEQRLPHGRGRSRPDAVQEARRQAADVHRLDGSGRAAAGHGRLLRGRREDDGRATTRRATFFRFFIAPGMGHCAGGPGPNQFDAPRRARAVGRERRRAGQADRDAQHQRQGRSHAAAVPRTRRSRATRAPAASTRPRTSRASSRLRRRKRRRRRSDVRLQASGSSPTRTGRPPKIKRSRDNQEIIR